MAEAMTSLAATNAMSVPLTLLIMYGAVRTGATFCHELRNTVFSKVGHDATRRIAGFSFLFFFFFFLSFFSFSFFSFSFFSFSFFLFFLSFFFVLILPWYFSSSFIIIILLKKDDCHSCFDFKVMSY